MNRKSDYIINILKCIVFVLLTVAFCVHYMGMQDYIYVLIWWVALVLLAVVFQPIAIILFRQFHDNGWIFSKTIGIAITAWVTWYLTSLKLFKFTSLNSSIVILGCFFINFFILFLYNKYGNDKIELKQVYSGNKIMSMINSEVIFFCFLSAWCYMKGYNPSAYGTEKFMDYGYVTAILKSDYMPAHDLWLSGNSINYYYVGQYISAFLIRISNVPVNYGYNLMMMTLAAFGFSLPYSLAYNLIKLNISDISDKKTISESTKRNIPAASGILAGLAVSVSSSMHFPFYKWIMPKINQIRGLKSDNYWFADATRYIGYNPDVDDKTIHEFPSYSFILGDLHAHVINILFVITVLALLFAWLMHRRAIVSISLKYDSAPKMNIIKETFSPWLVMVMFFIGLFHMTNYWDFPIYFVVSGAIILFSNLVIYRYKAKAWLLTLIQAVAFIITGIIVALPFTLSFDSISSSINFCDRHSKFYQLVILWGLPVLVLLLFIVVLINSHIDEDIDPEMIDDDGNLNLKGNFFTRFLDGLKTSDYFAVIIALCAFGLVILPEVIYVVDIYGGAYQRANTMFKLVYQAFIMFGIFMSYVLVKLVNFSSGAVKKISIVLLVMLCSTFFYFFEATGAWFNGFYETLDASAFLQNENADDEKAVQWINENVPDDAIVLEMCGLSYSFFNRISVFTGNQTVLGWQTHEWLWRSSGDKTYPEMVSDRHVDVVTIYTSTSVKEVRDLIEKYNIDYIYVGEAEQYDGYVSSSSGGAFHGGTYTKIQTNHNLLKSLGEVIMIGERTDTKNYESYIVKVDHDKVITDEFITTTRTNAENLYKFSKPTRINQIDTDNNLVGYSVYEYDPQKNVTLENKYDVENNLVAYSTYSYEGINPKIGKDFDADGKLLGFWNYVEFDDNDMCVKCHYFAEDQSWVKTLKITYTVNGCPSYIDITYNGGDSENVTIGMSSNGKISNVTYNGANEVHLYSLYYEEDMVSMVKEYINGEEKYTYKYIY